MHTQSDVPYCTVLLYSFKPWFPLSEILCAEQNFPLFVSAQPELIDKGQKRNPLKNIAQSKTGLIA